MNETGMSLEKPNYITAREHYIIASTLGHSEAAYRLTFLNSTNRVSCSADYTLAINVFRNGIAKGDIPSLVYLGEMYENGIGIEKDFPNAINYYLKAEKAGNADAMVNLSLLERDGKYLKQNLDSAKERMNNAARRGSAKALYYNYRLGAFDTYRNIDSHRAELIRQAKRGDPYAQVFIYLAANEGFFDFPKLTDSAINPYSTFLEMATHQGFSGAQVILGHQTSTN